MGMRGEYNPINGSRTLKLSEYTVTKGSEQHRINKQSRVRVGPNPFISLEEAYQLIIPFDFSPTLIASSIRGPSLT